MGLQIVWIWDGAWVFLMLRGGQCTIAEVRKEPHPKSNGLVKMECACLPSFAICILFAGVARNGMP